ncbi:Rgp1 family protein [Pseudohyphozyma bogoriensis]|nr:Rgp1 family protein [Pseudohyphozyma bogoriensis]
MQSASGSGLVVRITPSQSAFFAGETFAATITFTNPAPAVAAPSLHALHSLSHLPSQPRTANPAGPSSSRAPPQPAPRPRPANASHLGLAEYASSHLDSDEVPPSPFIGSSGFGDISGDSSNDKTPPSGLAPVSARESTPASSGGALPTPKSATFNPAPPPTNNHPYRSFSNANSPVASTSKAALPTRKGLIGKPIAAPKAQDAGRRGPGGSNGIYGSGPRRPGDFVRAHGRSQSMATSSPDLLEGAGSLATGGGHGQPKTHGRSRLGGSVGGEVLAAAFGEDRKKSAGRLPPAIREEDASPPLPDDDSFNSTPATSTPSFASPPFPSSPQRKGNNPYIRRQSDALSSTFSLANSDNSDLDGMDENNPITGHGFYGVGQNDTMESVVREGVEDWTRKATQEGSRTFGGSLSRSSSINNIRSAAASRNPFLHPPNTITVLWSFAHLEGTFEVEDSLIKPAEFVEVKRALLGGAGVGGGTLEEPSTRSGWKDWLWGGGESQKRQPASLAERKTYTMKEKTIPTFSSPPSILGVDLVLEPGQSKSYSFSIRVPADLPPSFRGKAIKFSYHLVVGTNRSQFGPLAPGGASARDSVSRVMRVPVRVYNHVGVTGARPFYDLTNPIIHTRDEATTSEVEDVKVAKPQASRPAKNGKAEFEAYAAALLDSVMPASPVPRQIALSPSLGTGVFSPTMMEGLPASRPEMRPRMESEESGVGLRLDEEESMGCKAAVEIVSRNSQKVSYDINKDGYLVASLTLVKSAYRLGETVNGSVVINSSEGRVLRVSARLETHELIETTISTRSAPQVRAATRRLHAEHHETTIDSARIGFALAIPSGATPDFATSGVKLQWSVRLSFLVIPPSPDSPIGGPPPRTGRSGPSLLNGGPQKPQASTAPRHGRSKSFAYGFEPAVPLTLPAAPLIQPTGAAHLMPVYGPLDSSAQHTSYRAVPDLGFVPVLFSSTPTDQPPTPGPLQRSAQGASHRPSSSVSLSRAPSFTQPASVVLVPAKVETVGCSIPIKCFPGNTPL